MAELAQKRTAIRAAFLKHWPILVPYAIFFVLVRAWFSHGIITGEDFRQFGWLSMPVFDRAVPWPSAWDPTFGFGLSLQLWMETFPLMAFGGALAHAGLTWGSIERVLLFFPFFVLVVISPYALFVRLFRSPAAAALGALLFCLNTYTVSLIERGHIPALTAYALIPLGLLVIIRSLERPYWQLAILYGLIIEVQFVLELRYAYLSMLCAAIVGVVWAIALRREFFTRERFVFIGTVFATLIGLNLYWILPTLLYKPRVPGGFSDLFAFIGATKDESLIDAFANYHPYYHHVLSSDDFGVTSVEPGFIVMSLFAVGGYIADRARLFTRAVFVMWAFAVIFVTGAVWPFVQLNEWIFQHAPGMFLFRESAKVMSVTSLGVAYGVTALAYHVRNVQLLSKRRYASVVVCVLLGIFAVWLMRDAYNPMRFSNFSAYPDLKADAGLRAFLDDTAGAGRVVYFPDTPLGIAPTVKNPAVSAIYGFTWKYPPEGMANFAPSPSSMYGTLDSALAPQLLCELGVRYIAIDPDPYSDLYRPWYFNVTRGEALRYFERRSWLTRIDVPQQGVPSRSRYVVYRLTQCAQTPPVAFVTASPMAFNGNETALQAVASTPLWSNRAAALLSSDQTPRQFSGAPAAVSGELFYDSQAFARAAESTGRKPAVFRADMLANASQASRAAQANGFVIDRDAEARITGDRNPLGMRGLFTVTQPGVYHVYRRTVPRASGRGIIWQQRFGGKPLRRIDVAIPLAEHPVIEIGAFRKKFGRVTLTYVLRGPDGPFTATDELPAPADISSDAYVAVQSALLRARSVQLQYDAAAVYSHPVWDAADYTIERIEVHPALAAAFASIAIPQSAISTPILEDVKPHAAADLAAVVDLHPWARTTVSYKVPLVQPADATALAFQFSASRLPSLRVRLTVRDAASGRQTTTSVPLDGLADCYVCNVQVLAEPAATPLGVPFYDGTTSSPDVIRVVLPLAHVLDASAAGMIDPRVTSLTVDATWARYLLGGSLNATLRNIAFRRWVWSDTARVEPDGARVVIDGKPIGTSVVLRRGQHTISTQPHGTADVDSVLLLHGAAPKPHLSTLVPIKTGFSEIVGRVRAGAGLLVFPQTYMYGWRVAVLPQGASATGNPYVDAWRLHRFMLPENTHRIVNGNLNGWIVPNLNGRIVLIFMPTVVSAYGALATFVLICCLAIVATVWRRRA